MREIVEYVGCDGESTIAIPRLKTLKEQKKLEISMLGTDVESQLTRYAAEERFNKCPACTLCYHKPNCSQFFDNYPDDTEVCERYTEKYIFSDGSSHTQGL